MNDQIANRRRGHVLPKRLPIVAVIEGDENRSLRPGKEKSFANGIFADGIHGRVVWKSADDLRPRFAAVVRSVDVWLLVVEPDSIDGCVRGVVGKSPGVYYRDFAP